MTLGNALPAHFPQESTTKGLESKACACTFCFLSSSFYAHTRVFATKAKFSEFVSETYPIKMLSFSCVGCDIVQADHAPEAGVAQGIFHGILVRHQGKHQEEVEEGLEEEVERRVKREYSSNQTQVRMHG